VATVGLSTDPADNMQPATGYRNMVGIDEDDPLSGARVGYVAVAAKPSATVEKPKVEGGKFKQFIHHISKGHVRPAGYEINAQVAYTVLAKDQAVPTEIKNGKSAQIVVAKPMPNTSVAVLARLDTNQPPSVYRNMRIGYVALPAFALIIALILLVFFPITAKKAAEIRAQLEARRGKV
jgi:hypothetical protein